MSFLDFLETSYKICLFVNVLLFTLWISSSSGGLHVMNGNQSDLDVPSAHMGAGSKASQQQQRYSQAILSEVTSC